MQWQKMPLSASLVFSAVYKRLLSECEHEWAKRWMVGKIHSNNILVFRRRCTVDVSQNKKAHRRRKCSVKTHPPSVSSFAWVTLIRQSFLPRAYHPNVLPGTRQTRSSNSSSIKSPMPERAGWLVLCPYCPSAKKVEADERKKVWKMNEKGKW